MYVAKGDMTMSPVPTRETTSKEKGQKFELVDRECCALGLKPIGSDAYVLSAQHCPKATYSTQYSFESR